MMDAATIAAGLERPRKSTDGGWTTCCPAHDDKSPSFSVSDGDKGVVVFCHGGCSQSEVIDALKSKGLWESKSKATGKKATGKKNIVATYDYISADGELIFQVVRFDPKDFRQRQPVGNGWQWNLKGVNRIPYRLPEVMAAAKGIVIVEGEKDADNLARLGITATTCAGGAEKWASSYNQYFKEKSVYILPDNDDAGRKHANTVARHLWGVAKTIKIVALPDLPEKGDVSDWLAQGGTKADLGALIVDTSPWSREPEPKALSPEPERPIDSLGIAGDQGDWRRQLMTKDDGSIIANVNNAQTLLSYQKDIAGVLGFNQFAKTVDILIKPPWEPEATAYPRQLTDVDDTRATAWLERHGCSLAINVVHNTMISAAHHNPFHPLQSYLGRLSWDGKERLTGAMTAFFGCENNDYARAVSRRFLIGSVARALSPGCKMDTMLILEGRQGLKKSTAVAELYHERWFTDELSDIGSKDAAMQMQGVWCIEVAELATMYRAESNRLKEWLTRRVDRFRPPYGRNLYHSPRQCVLVGTVNPEGGYLKDATGGRRFWPLRCGTIRVENITENRDQVWAEAVKAYNSGERWWFDSDERRVAEAQQEDRYESDPWEDEVLDKLGSIYSTSIREVMRILDLPSSQQTQLAQNRIAKILTSTGWDRKQRRVGGARKWIYERRSLGEKDAVD